MLARLHIHNIVLIEKLALEFEPGLNVLTGETGSGKSIILDALGLVLGGRAESRLVRHGAESASVTAEFDLGGGGQWAALFEELGIEADASQPLILRRQLAADGKSRAFLNDMPVSATALRQIGDHLVEIHGQHDQRGLMEASTHRSLLDAFGAYPAEQASVQQAYHAWKTTSDALQAQEEAMRLAQAQEDYLRHVVKELKTLNPQPGEEDELAEARRQAMQWEKRSADWRDAYEWLNQPRRVTEIFRQAERLLTRANAPEDEEILTALASAADQAELAMDILEKRLSEPGFDSKMAESAEERLFALRAAARKHQCTVEELPQRWQAMQEQLAAIDQGQENSDALRRQLSAARQSYDAAAQKLSELRRQAATKLESRVLSELAPLKLGQAKFVVQCQPASEPSAHGTDKVEFLVAANPGTPPASLGKVASGGELSRLMLALKVVLSEVDQTPTLIFDEVDTGIGGATAEAVGARLRAVSTSGHQVLVVTHQPQVAAQADRHFTVAKRMQAERMITEVLALSSQERREELARMLAGETVTDQARAAADALLQGAA